MERLNSLFREATQAVWAPFSFFIVRRSPLQLLRCSYCKDVSLLIVYWTVDCSLDKLVDATQEVHDDFCAVFFKLAFDVVDILK